MQTIKIRGLRLGYEKYGQGDTKVLAFHGNNKGPDDFKILIQEERTIFSICLFHHGGSHFPKKRIIKNPLQDQEFIELIEKLLVHEEIEKFHLIGHSQGGRLALKIYEKLAPKVQTLTLLAPDGIQLKGYYDRMSRKRIVQRLLKLYEKIPIAFKLSMLIAYRVRKVSKGTYEFTKSFSSSRKKMKSATRSWISFRDIQTEPLDFGVILKENKTPFKLIMGKHDGIFPPSIGRSFLTEANLEMEPIAIECGHNFFKKQNIRAVLEHISF